jgi:rubrerythrin
MQHFVNNGYGWTCRHCTDAETARQSEINARARFFSEGEAEEREPKLSVASLARWRDESRRELVCPKCGVVAKTEER